MVWDRGPVSFFSMCPVIMATLFMGPLWKHWYGLRQSLTYMNWPRHSVYPGVSCLFCSDAHLAPTSIHPATSLLQTPCLQASWLVVSFRPLANLPSIHHYLRVPQIPLSQIPSPNWYSSCIIWTSVHREEFLCPVLKTTPQAVHQ